MPDAVSFGSREYWIFLGLLLFSRSADFFSTWIATPNLVLEANPIARKLGWRWGIPVNLALCLGFALWPLSAIIITTTSVLVAARNFQAAWLMRTAGEQRYRDWMSDRMHETPFSLFLFCLFANTLLIALVGTALILFGGPMLVPFGIGIGFLGYAVVVLIYTLLSVRRRRDETSRN
jgi:hypothetical protein